MSNFGYCNFLKTKILINTANLPFEHNTLIRKQIIGIHEHKDHWTSTNKSENSFLLTLEAWMISLIRGISMVMFMEASLRKWKVFRSISVPGSPQHYALRVPTAVPGSMCPRRKGAEEDMMHQRKVHHICWGQTPGYHHFKKIDVFCWV